eukprot:TRINITY_DN16777_c0_g1_i1.p1 TRINITY_DN16777_c0_g1~~TRINITY_DN16777_c0_g1_i1.p1  ORF type:complete len:301 (-),score=117.51 TRINITY_DN16777_c0_g1_i1:106-966(-)
MPAATYADLGKDARDLLSKNYLSKSKVAFDNTSSSGANFVSTVSRNDDNSVSADVATKHKFSDVEVKANFSSSGVHKVEASVQDLGVEGLKAATSLSTKQDISANFSYKAARGSLGTNFLFNLGTKQPVLQVSANVKASDAVNVGLDCEYAVGDNPELKRVAAAVEWKQSADNSINLTFKNDGDASTVGTSYWQTVGFFGRDGAIAGTLDHNLKKSTTKVAVGVQYRLDIDTTLRSKVDTTGRVGLAYVHHLSADTKVTIGADLDATALDSAKGHKFNLAFNVGGN